MKDFSNTMLLVLPLFNLCHLELRIDHGRDASMHVLDKLNFRQTKSLLIWNIIDMIVSLTVFTMSASNLQVELFGEIFKNLLVGFEAEIREVYVDGGAHTGADIGRAWSEISKSFIVRELEVLFELFRGTR